MDGRRN